MHVFGTNWRHAQGKVWDACGNKASLLELCFKVWCLSMGRLSEPRCPAMTPQSTGWGATRVDTMTLYLLLISRSFASNSLLFSSHAEAPAVYADVWVKPRQIHSRSLCTFCSRSLCALAAFGWNSNRFLRDPSLSPRDEEYYASPHIWRSLYCCCARPRITSQVWLSIHARVVFVGAGHCVRYYH